MKAPGGLSRVASMDLALFPPPGVFVAIGLVLIFLGIFLAAREPRKPDRGPAGSNRSVTVALIAIALGSASLAAEFVIDVARLPPGGTISFRYSVSVEPSPSVTIRIRLPAPADPQTWDRMHATNGASSLALSGSGENLTVEIVAAQIASFDISMSLTSASLNTSLTRLRYGGPNASYTAFVELLGNGTGTAAAWVHLSVSFEGRCWGRIYMFDQSVSEGEREYPVTAYEVVC